MDATRKMMTKIEDAMSVFTWAPFNHYSHGRTFPTASFRNVVLPNSYALFSIA